MTTKPSTGADDALLKQVQSMIRLQETTSTAGSVGRLAFGAGACLLIGLVSATLMTIFLYGIFGSGLIGWWGWFGVYLAVLVALLIWKERGSRGDYVPYGVQLVGPNSSSREEHPRDRMSSQIAKYASWLVWGPHAVLDGFQGIRGRRTRAQHAMLDRAALLVVDLSRAMQGIEVKDLLHPPESMETFSAAVDLLDKYNWIGRATDGRSLWLNSVFRQKLLEQTRAAK